MPRISELTRVNEVSDGDVFPIEQASSGRTRSVAFKTIRDDISADVDAAVSIAVAAAAAAEQAAASSDAQVLRGDLADGATALKGADLVAYDAVETVRDAIAASKQFDADLSNTTDPTKGAAIVGRALAGDSNKKYRILSFVIRQTTPGGGWVALDDSGHAPTGLDSIVVTGNDLALNFNFTASKVGTFVVTPDETFTAQGVTVGASVGTSSAILSFFAPIGGVVSGLGVGYNTTLGNVTSQIVNTDSIVINHISTTHTNAAGQGVSLSKLGTNSYLPAVEHNKTSLTIKCKESFSGRFACTTTTPGAEVFTLTENGGSTGFSASWDAAKQCVIVSHPVMLPSGPRLYFQQSRDAPVRYLLSTDTHATGSVELHFYDTNGVKITAATNSMIFYAYSNDAYPINLPGSTSFASVSRQEVPCNADQLYNAVGNFWVFGVFEVS